MPTDAHKALESTYIQTEILAFGGSAVEADPKKCHGSNAIQIRNTTNFCQPVYTFSKPSSGKYDPGCLSQM
jgi:hypothetical protein